MSLNRNKLKNLLTNIVTFDIETELISKEFFDLQKEHKDTFDFVPLPRVCVCYDSFSNKYETYLPEDFDKLYDKLIDRDVLSFNGLHFDINVILKHLGKNRDDPLIKKKNHYDLLALIIKETGRKYKLDDLVRANLNERKHTLGKKMKDMDIEKLTEACRSDVEQTYRLMKVFLKNEMVYKYYSVRSEEEEDFINEPGIRCSDPQGAMLLLKLDQETLEKRYINFLKHKDLIDNMTEGQLADYMAGFREDDD